jgi:hypothetical protein
MPGGKKRRFLSKKNNNGALGRRIKMKNEKKNRKFTPKKFTKDSYGTWVRGIGYIGVPCGCEGVVGVPYVHALPCRGDMSITGVLGM